MEDQECSEEDNSFDEYEDSLEAANNLPNQIMPKVVGVSKEKTKGDKVVSVKESQVVLTSGEAPSYRQPEIILEDEPELKDIVFKTDKKTEQQDTSEMDFFL